MASRRWAASILLQRMRRPLTFEASGSPNSPTVVGRAVLCLVGSLILWIAMTPAFAQELPDSPSGPIDVVASAGERLTQGHLSGRRSTHDGRVRVTGNVGISHRFHSTRVELFTRNLIDERYLSDGKKLRVDPAGFHASTAEDPVPDHIAICDPYLAREVEKNPYACKDAGKSADCYDVTILLVVHVSGVESPQVASELWSTPVTVTVSRPKTPDANVASIELRGPPVRSPIRRVPRKAGDVLLEPIVSGDGRLLFMNSGDTLIYSVMGESATPCDVRNWKRLDHISKMHGDPKMKRYGVARYPIRDSENRRVKTGRPVGGAYPWIDREGKNLFFAQVGGVGLFYRDADGELRSRLDLVDRPRRRHIEMGGPTRFGMSFVGLWTQGKIVIPDNRVNNIDFHIGRIDHRPRARLYREDSSGVRLGPGLISKINSPENQLNYQAPILPRSPRDVVWWLSGNNLMTGEVVFDDLLDLGSLIYSPMNAAVDNKRRDWRDGFDYKRMAGYVKTPRVQNAAASQLLWKVPTFGRLVGGRIEPIAAGGVVGKGLWLDGERGRVEYTVPNQDEVAMGRATWTTTISVDPREVIERRRLLSFPDGSWVDLALGRVILGGASSSEASFDLASQLQPRSRVWTHLAFVSTPAGIDLYVQGFKLGRQTGAYLRPRPGTLVVGRPNGSELPGLHGWIDDLRVVSGNRDPESICNYAHGTLRGLDETTAGADFSTAGLYPPASHEEVSAHLAAASRPIWDRYLCERKREAEESCLGSIHRPGGSDPSCVRPAILFPEGPLYHDRPRPDSRSNTFCRSCHSKQHPTPSLRVAGPLKAGPVGTMLADDDRRQPAQAPRRIHGFLPKGLLGLEQDMEAPPEGVLLDPLVYASAGSAPN